MKRSFLITGLQILSISLFFIIVNSFVNLFSIPIPSSVLGMLILTFLLITDLVPLRLVEDGALTLIRFMPIMFVPDGVALFQSIGIIKNKELAFLIVFIISTVLVMGIAGYSSILIQKSKTSQVANSNKIRNSNK